MSAKLARIKDVSFYVGLTPNVQACWDMKRFLDENGIPYKLLAYMDDSVHADIFKSLTSWTWGENGETRTFTSFPILTWVNCFDDFETHLDSATNIEEVRNKLLAHVGLIKQ